MIQMSSLHIITNYHHQHQNHQNAPVKEIVKIHPRIIGHTQLGPLVRLQPKDHWGDEEDFKENYLSLSLAKSSTLRRRLFSVKSLMKESLKQKNLKIFWISWLTLKATYRLDLCLCPPLPSWQAKVLSWKKSSFFAREESQPEEAVFPIWFVLPFKILKICFCRGRQRSATELTESFFTGFYWRLRLVNTRSSLEEVFFQIWNICQSLKRFLARLRSSTGRRELFYPRFVELHNCGQLDPG